MNHTTFAVSRFENSNGVTSWRVSGWFHGVRIRKNFKTREEAAAEKAALELKSVQAASGLRPVATSLSAEQVRDAEAAFRRLAGNARPLCFYLDFALANYREPEQRKKTKAAAADYLAAKEHELAQDHLSRPQMERIRSELKRFVAHFADLSLDEITPPRVVAYLEIGNAGLKTWNNRRGVISTFFRFAFYRGWVAENPLARIPQHRIRRKRGMAVTLDVSRARELMAFLEDYQGGKFVPYYALCLFAGIRPGVPYGEIKKLKPDAVNLDCLYTYLSIGSSFECLACRLIKMPPCYGSATQANACGKLIIDLEYERIGLYTQVRASLTHTQNETYSEIRTFVSPRIFYWCGFFVLRDERLCPTGDNHNDNHNDDHHGRGE